MINQNYSKVPVLITLLIFAFVTSFAEGKKHNQPNIIYILADDMGTGDVAAYNSNCKFPTPNLDNMAINGLMFSDAHSSSSVCTPTRYGILTGRYCWRTAKKSGVLQGHSNHLIDLKRETVASYLKKKGYSTACIGKWHLGMDWTSIDGKAVMGSTGKNVDFSKPIKNGPLDFGFDYYFGISASLNMPPHAFIKNRFVLGDLVFAASRDEIKELGLTGAKEGWVDKNFKQSEVLPELTRKTVSWIKKHQKENSTKPFFVYMPLNAPHSPIVPNEEFLGKSNLAPHGDFCMEVDWTVGEILKVLKELDIEENTLVIFTADNGVSPQAKLENMESQGHFSSYIYRGLKGSLYEGGHRVPFIAQWPAKVKPQTKSDFLICTTDLLATVADIQEEKLKDNVGEDSFSFLPVLKSKELNDEIRGGIVHHSDAGHFSIRKGKWKLVLHEGGGTRRSDPKDKPVINNPTEVQLFDMESDATELVNVQQNNPRVIEELKQLLADFVNKGRSTVGEEQKNDPYKHWDEIEVIKNFLK
jgi:arylsulfatase A